MISINKAHSLLNMNTILIAWTTTETQEDAENLANSLVEQQFVACAQIDGPITSVHSWEGKTQQSQEFRLTLKFPSKTLDSVQNWVHSNHPYDTPQWIILTSDQTSEAYNTWVHEATSQ